MKTSTYLYIKSNHYFALSKSKKDDYASTTFATSSS